MSTRRASLLASARNEIRNARVALATAENAPDARAASDAQALAWSHVKRAREFRALAHAA